MNRNEEFKFKLIENILKVTKSQSVSEARQKIFLREGVSIFKNEYILGILSIPDEEHEQNQLLYILIHGI